MRLRFEWIPEKHKEVNFALGNLRPNLLVTTQWPTAQLGHLQTNFFFQKRSRRSGRAQLMLRQQHSVEPRPFNQIALFIVMRNQSDPFFARNIYFCRFHTYFSPTPTRYFPCKYLPMNGLNDPIF